MRSFLYGWVAPGLLLGGMCQARSDVIYWGEYTQIQRANLDGSGQSILANDQHGAVAIALDVANGELYWTNGHGADNGYGGDIWRANLDGSGATSLVEGLQRPLSIALDVAGGQMYWANFDSGDIWKAKVDGSEATP